MNSGVGVRVPPCPPNIIMNTQQLIQTLGNITPPYVKNYDHFTPGELVQYSGQWWDHEEITIALEAFLTGKWITSGDYVDKFQQAFAQRFNVQHAHMVNSGSSANLVMVAALKKRFGWQDGDEIIVSPVGFPTTIAPIVQNGLKPIFVDIELETMNFDVSKIEALVTEKTRGIFVSPVLGNPPDMDKIIAIANKHEILLIGDNCDSLGTRVNGKHISELYYCWSCSFYPAHHISTGEGGMVCTDDQQLINIVRSISWWGRDCYCVGAANMLACGTCGNRFSSQWLPNYDGVVDHKYVFTNMGYNLKPLDLQGAIGLAQLKKLDEIDRRRRLYKQQISVILSSVPGLRVINSLPNNDPSWFGVPIFCETQGLKEFFVSHLEQHKIQTRNYFSGNILLHSGYSHLDDYKKYPNSNLALSHVFFIGCSPLYNQKVIDYIKQVVQKYND